MEGMNNQIDQLFREGLGGYREMPPPAVWEALEQRLDQKRRRRIVPFWWIRLSLLACLFLSLGTAGLYLMNRLAPATQTKVPETASNQRFRPNTTRPTASIAAPAMTGTSVQSPQMKNLHSQPENQSSPDTASPQPIATIKTTSNPSIDRRTSLPTSSASQSVSPAATDTGESSNFFETLSSPLSPSGYTSPGKDPSALTSKYLTNKPHIPQSGIIETATNPDTKIQVGKPDSYTLKPQDSSRNQPHLSLSNTSNAPTPDTGSRYIRPAINVEVVYANPRKPKVNEGNREIRYDRPTEETAALSPLRSLNPGTTGAEIVVLATRGVAQQELPTIQFPQGKKGHRGGKQSPIPANEFAASTPSGSEKSAAGTSVNQTGTVAANGLADAPKPDRPKKPWQWNLPIDAGIKGGFEHSAGGIAVLQLFIAPYVQWKMDSKISFFFQPAVRVNNLAQSMRLADGAVFHQITNASLDSSDSWIIGSSSLQRTYLYRQTYDSIRISTRLNAQRFLEIELPALVQYQISKEFAFLGGLSMTIGKILKLEQIRETYSDLTRAGSVTQSINVINPGPYVPPPAYQNFFSYNSPDIRQLNGSSYDNATSNPPRFSLMLGMSYTLNDRWQIDAMLRQNLSNLQIIPNEQVRNIYNQPSIRINVGYKLFSAKAQTR